MARAQTVKCAPRLIGGQLPLSFPGSPPSIRVPLLFQAGAKLGDFQQRELLQGLANVTSGPRCSAAFLHQRIQLCEAVRREASGVSTVEGSPRIPTIHDRSSLVLGQLDRLPKSINFSENTPPITLHFT